MRAHGLKHAMPWLVFLGFLLVWQGVVDVFALEPFVLPSPVAVVQAYLQFQPTIISQAAFTLVNTLLGFALGVAGGLMLGIVIGSSELAYRGLYPMLIGFNSVPKVALTPILVLWLGIGQPPAIATACLLCFFPIAVNVATGLATVEPEMTDLLRSLGASRTDILRKVGLPRTMPLFFAALKVSITLAFVGAVISETIASNAGIGFLLLQASSQLRIPLLFAGVAVTAAMGVAVYGLFAIAERRLTSWSTRRTDVQTIAIGG